MRSFNKENVFSGMVRTCVAPTNVGEVSKITGEHVVFIKFFNVQAATCTLN